MPVGTFPRGKVVFTTGNHEGGRPHPPCPYCRSPGQPRPATASRLQERHPEHISAEGLVARPLIRAWFVATLWIMRAPPIRRLVTVLSVLALLLAGPLMRLIGAKIEAMITRILGVILAALAVQFVLDGLERSLPGLAG